MIVSFKDFINESVKRINEGNVPQEILDNEYELDSIDLKNIQDIEFPELVSDNKYLSKISNVVINYLIKSVEGNYYVSPFVVKVNDKDTSIICSDRHYFAVFKDGIKKTIVYFKQNPLEGNVKNEFAVSTEKLGYLAAIKTMCNFINFSTDGGINEARTTPEITTATYPDYLSVNQLVQKINGSKKFAGIQKADMNELLKLYETMDDGEIADMLTNGSTLSPGLERVSAQLATQKDGTPDKKTAKRNVMGIHLALCACTIGQEPDEIAMMKTMWFYGAGTSGKLATYLDSNGVYQVKESQSLMDERVKALDDKMVDIYDACKSMCEYIKSGGRVDNMRGELGEGIRGLIIAGAAGIGKTVSLDKAIEETKLRNGLDYQEMGGSTGANEVYGQLYRYNNMLLIFDDTPDMWTDNAKISLWKKAMETNPKKRILSRPSGTAKTNSKIFYDAADPNMTRQEQYFKEIGKISPADKKKWLDNRKTKLINGNKRAMKTDSSIEPMTDNEALALAEEAFKEEVLAEMTPLIPDRFLFNGLIIYITNLSLSDFIRSTGNHWEALKRRFFFIDVSPTQKVIWAWIRKKILDQAKDTSIPDSQRIFPLTSPAQGYSVEKVVEYIDEIMNGNYNGEDVTYGSLNFGTISAMKGPLTSPFPENKWKRKLLEMTIVDATRY